MSDRYRVWCLSWDDEEEHGRDVVGPSPREDQRAVIVVAGHLDARRAVEVYADWCEYHRDGRDDSWPCAFRVRKPDGATEDFEVERPHADLSRVANEGGCMTERQDLAVCRCDFCTGVKRYDDNWCSRCAKVQMQPPKWWENVDVCDACEVEMREAGEIPPAGLVDELEASLGVVIDWPDRVAGPGSGAKS